VEDASVIQEAARIARPVLSLPAIRRTRRNHGLEHATITILAERIRPLSMAGRSDSGGFILLGEVNTEHVESAVAEALRRFRRGERGLAVHPNCGTNLVTTSLFASVAAMLGLAGVQRGGLAGRLPSVMALVALALLISQPLGLALQRHFTTDGDMGDLQVVSIRRSSLHLPFRQSAMTVHRVTTRSG
jgi:hypothetical protein